MADCGCGCGGGGGTGGGTLGTSRSYNPTTLSPVSLQQSNADGPASWFDDSSLDSPAIPDIAGQSPYGIAPSFGGVSFCRKCFLTWVGVFLLLALIFFNRK